MGIEKQAIENIVEAMNDDTLIIFVGAGVSANSGLPSWGQLVNEFEKELDINNSITDYLKIAQFYYDIWGQQKYYQKIMDIFSRHNDAKPNDIHKHILKIHPKHLITTNYDTLLEDMMNSSIDKYDILKRDEDIPYSNSGQYIIKMHGDLALKNIVLKENDYLDYEENFYMISTLIKSLIMNNTLLFIGYSLGDSTFNSIFRLIQKSLGGDAKHAYFFTPQKQDEPVIEYYKKRGIYVLSSSEEVDSSKLGEYTVDFLNQISSKIDEESLNEVVLWKKIKFLDKLFFIESRDIAGFSGLNKHAWLTSPDQFVWRDRDSFEFNVGGNSELINFIEEKTSLSQFLGIDMDQSNMGGLGNPVLTPAFELYKEKKFSLAKVKFREIANTSFAKKDYFNFLLAEFNVAHINPGFFEEKVELDDTVYKDGSFDSIMDRIIDSSKEDLRKIAIFFRDVIYNFKFVYRKLSKIDVLMDKLRQERVAFKNGGYSSNNILLTVKYEFYSFIDFIEKNCICVNQYQEYQLVVSRYFECLLIALDNSYYNNDENNYPFEGTSSIIEALDLDNIKYILPNMNKKMLKVYLDNYSMSKLKVTNEALDYIIESIQELCKINKGPMDVHANLLNQTIDFLNVVDLNDGNFLVDLLAAFPVYYNNRDAIRKIIQMILCQNKTLSEDNLNKLREISKEHVEIIIKNNFAFHEDNYPYYSKILELDKDISRKSIFFADLTQDLSIILFVEDKPTRIVKYSRFLGAFYKFLEVEQKKLVDAILSKYSNLAVAEIDFHFVIEMIKFQVNDFITLKDDVFQNLVDKVNKDITKGVKFYPDPLEVAITDIFALVQLNYFSLESISEAEIDEKIKGKFPEVDWMMFNVRNDITIENLLKNHDFYQARESFSKNDHDKEMFNSWAISQFETGKAKVDNKNV